VVKKGFDMRGKRVARRIVVILAVTPWVLLAWPIAVRQAAATSDRVLVPFRSQWSVLAPQGFLDDPGLTDSEFDTRWWMPDFDDASWSGPYTGPFVYGRVDALRSSEPYPLPDPGDGNRYTYYFRHAFTTTEAASRLFVEFVADDGAVFYLDGQEVLRHNCCVDLFQSSAEDDYLAFADLPSTGESLVTRPILGGQRLAPGEHVLAVSVHPYATVSRALGFEMRLLSAEVDQIVIDSGIDTTVAEAGLNGPDQPHGAAGQNPDGVQRWEWDQVDRGGKNQGLLWFDIPQVVLDDFQSQTATLRLHVDDDGQSADLHRMTVDWLSGPNGGNNVTWNNLLGGPGIVPGANALEVASSITGDLLGAEGEIVEIDVTQDVLAWSSGQPNYGWGFLPTGGDATAISSFESMIAPAPQLVIRPNDSTAVLQAGDADQDLAFDQLDLVQVQTVAKYLTGQPATWGEGDWDGAPGGSPGDPTVGDGRFNQLDLIAALRHGLYRTGPYATVTVPDPATVTAVDPASILARETFAVPEPASGRFGLLLVAGLWWLAGWRWQRGVA
jgi:hypothetical protein